MKLPAFLALLVLAALGGWWLRREALPPETSPAPATSSPLAPPAAVTAPFPAFTTPRNQVVAAPAPPSSPPSVAEQIALLQEAIRQKLFTGDEQSREQALREMLPALLAHDPLATARFVASWPPGPLREQLLREFARLWSATDIHVTLAWLTTLPPSDRALAAPAALELVRQTDPAGALAAAQVLRVGLDDGTVEYHVQMWTEENPGAVLAWLRSQPPGEIRDRLATRAILTRAQRDPHEGIALLELLAPENQGRTREELLRQWQQRDPAAVAAWRAENQ